MASRKSRLTRVAATIGGALGKADRKAHKIIGARSVAEKELRQIAKQIDALKRQLEMASKRLRRAID